MKLSTLLIATVMTTSSLVASADTLIVESNARPAEGRTGVVLGVTLDGGDIGCQSKNGASCGDGAHAAEGLSVHAGGMISPFVAIVGEAWGMSYSENGVDATQLLLTANVRGWVLPRLWLQGGLGVARSDISSTSGAVMVSDESATVPAFVLGVGFEMLRSRVFALDLEARGGSGFYQDDARVYNAALGIGATWF